MTTDTILSPPAQGNKTASPTINQAKSQLKPDAKPVRRKQNRKCQAVQAKAEIKFKARTLNEVLDTLSNHTSEVMEMFPDNQVLDIPATSPEALHANSNPPTAANYALTWLTRQQKQYRKGI